MKSAGGEISAQGSHRESAALCISQGKRVAEVAATQTPPCTIDSGE